VSAILVVGGVLELDHNQDGASYKSEIMLPVDSTLATELGLLFVFDVTLEKENMAMGEETYRLKPVLVACSSYKIEKT
jgi:hypothetical protein